MEEPAILNIQRYNMYLPELFKSMPPSVRFTSPPRCGNVLYTRKIVKLTLSMWILTSKLYLGWGWGWRINKIKGKKGVQMDCNQYNSQAPL
jgi:hypothetical protein